MSRRSCRQNLNRLRIHRSYTMRELGFVLGVHVRTVQSWHKQGMTPISESVRPFLFMGNTVQEFLQCRRKTNQCRLEDHQFYCLRCRAGVSPNKRSVTVEVTQKRVGRDAKQVIIKATCPICGGTVVRFASTKTIHITPWGRCAGGSGLDD